MTGSSGRALVVHRGGEPRAPAPSPPAAAPPERIRPGAGAADRRRAGRLPDRLLRGLLVDRLV